MPHDDVGVGEPGDEAEVEKKKHKQGTSVVTPPAYRPAPAPTSPALVVLGSIRPGFPAAPPPVLRVCRRSAL